MAVREETLTQERYLLRYGPEVLPATVAVEREVLGGDYGGNGYTTLEEADRLALALGLTSGHRLLDLGSGCGWPGLRLARTTGCSAVLTDLSLPAMQRARRRAVEELTQARTATVVASARHLPFAPESFDAIVHTDVLCWLGAKLSVLRACCTILRPGGCMAFFTITLAAGLSVAEHRRATRAGPPAVASRDDTDALLCRAGFDQISETDVTGRYLRTARAWLEVRDRYRGELEVGGCATFVRDQRDRKAAIEAIEAGWLRRQLFTAVRPT